MVYCFEFFQGAMKMNHWLQHGVGRCYPPGPRAPEHVSHLSALLGQHTTMEPVQAINGEDA